MTVVRSFLARLFLAAARPIAISFDGAAFLSLGCANLDA